MVQNRFGRLAGLALVLAATACSNVQTRPGTAYDRIAEELKPMPADRARQERPEAVDRALLPPAQADLPRQKPLEPRFDLAVNNAPAAQVFMAIVSGTRYGMVVQPDLGGTLTLNLKDVTVGEALETIRELYGYDYTIQGTRIMVKSNSLQTRLFQINYLASRRAGMSSTRVFSGSVTSSGSSSSSGTTSGTGSTSSSTSRTLESASVETTQFNDFWQELAEALGGLLGCDVRHGTAAGAQPGAAAGAGSSGGTGLVSQLGGQRTTIACRDGRNLVQNQQAGVVMVRAMPAELRAVEEYLKAIQVVVERQVMIEAKIVEVQLKDGFESGINWTRFNDAGAWRWSAGSDTRNLNFDGSQAPGSTIGNTLGSGILGSTGRTDGGLFGLAFRTTSFAALLQFLESQGYVQVLSSPRIATLNNQKAVLKVGVDEFFVTSVSSSTTTTSSGTTSAPTITLQPFFSGIALDVTPQIDEEDHIILHVHPSISTVAEKTKTINLGSLGTYQLPLATSAVNETDSIVRVPDGQIVAIGGLMKESQFDDKNQVPGAGEVPILGAFFGNKSRGYTKREVVVLIRPTVIQGNRQWQQDLEETRRRLGGFDPRRSIADQH